MERSDIWQEQMKRSVNTEYFKRVISALKSKLNANVFQAWKCIPSCPKSKIWS